MKCHGSIHMLLADQGFAQSCSIKAAELHTAEKSRIWKLWTPVPAEHGVCFTNVLASRGSSGVGKMNLSSFLRLVSLNEFYRGGDMKFQKVLAFFYQLFHLVDPGAVHVLSMSKLLSI